VSFARISFSSVLHGLGAGDLPGDGGEKLFGEAHQIVVRRVGLVELEHRELRVVLGGDALVPEILVYLEHPVHPPHQEPLEVQLRGDAEEEIHVQGVVMGDEWPGGGAAHNLVEHGRLHLYESPVREKRPHGGDNPGSGLEDRAYVRIDHQIHVAPTVAGLHVRQPVPFLRQGPKPLDQKPHGADVDRQLVGLGAKGLALHRDDIPDVQLLGVGEYLPQSVLLKKDLYAMGVILDVGEGGLPEVPLGHNPPRQGVCPGGLFQLVLGEIATLIDDLPGGVSGPEVVGIDHSSCRGDLVPLLLSDLDQVAFVGLPGLLLRRYLFVLLFRLVFSH